MWGRNWKKMYNIFFIYIYFIRVFQIWLNVYLLTSYMTRFGLWIFMSKITHDFWLWGRKHISGLHITCLCLSQTKIKISMVISVCFFLVCLFISIDIGDSVSKKEKGWDPINWFNSIKYVCLSQAKDMDIHQFIYIWSLCWGFLFVLFCY